MIEIDITMVIQIINIVILIVIMNIVLYKPVRTVLAERAQKIASLGNDIKTFDRNAQLRQEEIDRKLAEARVKAKQEQETARSEAQKAGADIVAEIRKEATAAKDEQLAEIRKHVTAAREELKGQVDVFAAEMAGKILGRSI